MAYFSNCLNKTSWQCQVEVHGHYYLVGVLQEEKVDFYKCKTLKYACDLVLTSTESIPAWRATVFINLSPMWITLYMWLQHNKRKHMYYNNTTFVCWIMNVCMYVRVCVCVCACVRVCVCM